MHNVIIVDDEYLLRKLIVNSIDFRKYGFEVVGEAEDAYQAMELIDELAPQAAVVDINMPRMNGIELSELIKEKYPDIRIVILTGYSEFEYAKECIRIGVDDYILKPLDTDAFHKALERLARGLEKERARREYISKLETDASAHKELSRKEALRSLLLHAPTDTAPAPPDMPAGYSFFAAATVEIDGLEAGSLADSLRYIVYSLGSALKGAAGDSPKVLDCVQCDNRIVCVAAAASPDGESHGRLLEKMEWLRGFLRERCNFTVTAGVGGFYEGLGGIRRSYLESLEALEEKFLRGNDSVYSLKERAPGQAAQLKIPIELKEALKSHARAGDLEGFIETVRRLFRYGRSQNATKLSFQEACYEIAEVAIDRYREARRGADQDSRLAGVLSHISRQETCAALEEWTVQFATHVFSLLEDAGRTKPCEIVERAREYIAAHYPDQDLCLGKIAEQVFVSPGYLGKLFVREMKCPIGDYITELRMNAAREMMDANPRLQVNHIAMRVGFCDPFYFSKLFKKRFGVSPSKYLEAK